MGAEQSAPLAPPSVAGLAESRSTDPFLLAKPSLRRGPQPAPGGAPATDSDTERSGTASDSSTGDDAAARSDDISASSSPSATPKAPEQPADEEEPSPTLPDLVPPPSMRSHEEAAQSSEGHADAGTLRGAEPSFRSHPRASPASSARVFISRASQAIQQKQAALSSLVARMNADSSAAARQPQPWQRPTADAPRTPAKKWPTVTASTSSCGANSHTRVMARFDTVTTTLHGVGNDIVRATPPSQVFRGSADVWGDDDASEQAEPSALEA